LNKGNHHYAEDGFKGDPLGELVLWVNLITSVYILGYNITLTTEVSQLISIINKKPSGGCPTIGIDII